LSKLPAVAFAALVAATVGAFFVTQHLKVTTPLLAGLPAPHPAVINPLNGSTCGGVNHRRMVVSFYLLHRSDDVDVSIVDQSGAIIRTLASGRHMRKGVRRPDGVFVWDGRQENGSIAPDGIYYIRVALLHQGRTVTISNSAGPEPVTVKTLPPRPVVTSVSPSLIPQGSTPVTIHYAGNEDRGVMIRIYRTDVPGKPRLANSFRWGAHRASWDGHIHQQPAPAGTYLVGLDVTDVGCNTGHFPLVLPPPPGSTPHAGVTVRYLAAQPPLVPVTAGSRAVVYVDSRRRPYRWLLWRAGVHKTISSGRADRTVLRVQVPARRGAGLYHLALRSGPHSTAVPLVVNQARRAHILVVLPALTWQGLNPVDDNADGMPNTLPAGGPIQLARPFANGLPGGFSDEAGILGYLDATHRSYELTTDLALMAGIGPTLSGHRAVVLAGSERWLPVPLSSALRAYVLGGGNVLSTGVDSLLRSVSIRASTALDPTGPSATDALGARPGSVVAHSSAPIAVIRDGLGIFSSTAGLFPGFTSYQPFTSVAPPAQIRSAAGVSDTAPSVVGYQLGRGTVVDIGLPGFGSHLARDIDARELMGRLWNVLSR
jgi:hypothetical protein